MTFTAEIDLDFDFSYIPGEAPTYDYPGSGAEVDITKVRLNGVEIPLSAITQKQYGEMVEQVIDNQ